MMYGDIDKEYEKYCKIVPEHNRLKYNGWITALQRDGMEYEDMHNYIMKCNRPEIKEYAKYKTLCTDCDPFDLPGFRIKFFKDGFSMDEVIEATRNNKYIYRRHMTHKKPLTKTGLIIKEKTIKRGEQMIRLRLKRIELGHPLI